MFDVLFYNPIYNLMVFLSNHLIDFGWVVIVATIIIKVILYPIFSGQIKNQIATKKAQPELKEIQKQLKDKNLDQFKRQELMFKMMAVNKKYGVKILAPLINMVFSITILIALYWIIYKGGFPKIDKSILYSFVNSAGEIKMTFLNYFDLTQPSKILAVLAGLTQFLYMQVSMPDVKFSDLKPMVAPEKGQKPTEDMMQTFQVYMKYGLPVMIFFMAFGFMASLTLYWITSNLFMIFQERMVRGQKNELKKMN